MENSSALENKYYRIVEELGEQQSFFFDEVQAVFPDMKKSSLYWNLSKLVDGGYLKRIRNGVYAFNEWKDKKSISISGIAERIRDIMDETGFDYYISGVGYTAEIYAACSRTISRYIVHRKRSKR